MMYYLADGSIEWLDSENQEGKLRDLIREHMGADMATCYDDVVSDIRVDIENQADEYMGTKAASLCSRIEAIIYSFNDYLKTPDSLKRQLNDLTKEIKEYSLGFYPS